VIYQDGGFKPLTMLRPQVLMQKKNHEWLKSKYAPYYSSEGGTSILSCLEAQKELGWFEKTPTDNLLVVVSAKISSGDFATMHVLILKRPEVVDGITEYKR
jgi:hypothetical protein